MERSLKTNSNISSRYNKTFRTITTLSGGILLAIGISACGSTAAPTNKTHAKTEAHTVDITEKNLTGVDTQLNLSSATDTLLAQQHVSIAAVAPASINFASVSSLSPPQAISLPIISGNFVFDKTDHHLTGTIDHSGGFRLIIPTKPTVAITDMTINLTTHKAVATVNGKSDLPIFNLVGTANVAQQGVHTTITGLSVEVSPNSPTEIKTALGSSTTPIGTITITSTSVK